MATQRIAGERRRRISGSSVAALVVIHAAGAMASEGPGPVRSPPPRAGEVAAPAVRKMTLAEALFYARAHQLRLLAARKRLVAARKDADVPGARWWPRVGAFAQVVGASTNNTTATLLGNAAVDVARIGATPVPGTYDLSPYASTAVALGVRQQLYDFGRIAAERAAAELAARAEGYRVAGLALDVDFAVEQAYYAVLAATAVEDASRSAFERASLHRDLARANVVSGLRSPIELTRAEADAARYEAGTVRASGALHVARGALAAIVGVDDEELDAAGASPAPPPLPPIEALLTRSRAAPIVREMGARLEAERAETRRLEAQTRPELLVTAGVTGRAGGAPPSSGPVPPGDGWLPVVPNYDVGVVLSWPLLDPVWGRRADASRARARARELDRDQALRAQRALVSASWHEADVSAKALAALERATLAAKANYQQAEQRFKVGLGTSTELADAQAVRTEADIQLAIGNFQAARARAALDRAIAETK